MADRDKGFLETDYIYVDKPAYFHGLFAETKMFPEQDRMQVNAIALITFSDSGQLSMVPLHHVYFTNPDEEGARYAVIES